MNCKGWGIPPDGVTEFIRLIIRNNNIYGLGVGLGTVSEIKPYMNLRVGAYSRGIPVVVNGCVLSKETTTWFMGADLDGV